MYPDQAPQNVGPDLRYKLFAALLSYLQKEMTNFSLFLSLSAVDDISTGSQNIPRMQWGNQTFFLGKGINYQLSNIECPFLDRRFILSPL